MKLVDSSRAFSSFWHLESSRYLNIHSVESQFTSIIHVYSGLLIHPNFALRHFADRFSRGKSSDEICWNAGVFLNSCCRGGLHQKIPRGLRMMSLRGTSSVSLKQTTGNVSHTSGWVLFYFRRATWYLDRLFVSRKTWYLKFLVII
jgi:hypothetical protein